jgi:hypothetical protein
MSIGKPDKRKTLLASLCALIGGLSLWSTPALACPNEELRQGPSSALPDCRAYEMVSPLAKNGFFVNSGHAYADGWGQAAAAGGAVTYTSLGAFPGSVTNAVSNFYLAFRGEAGWPTLSLLPPQAFSYGSSLTEPVFAAYSADLSRGILLDATDSPALVSGEQETTTEHTANLFLRDNATGAYSLINAAAPGTHPSPYQPILDGASADFGTVIFDATAALTPEAPNVDNLYEWSGGAVSLVSQIPPAGQPSCGPAGPACLPAPHGGKFGSANDAFALTEHGSLVRAISSDGSRIFFTAEGDLYVRENATTTVQVDASQAQPPGPGGGGVWATAAADGSQVFFYDDASAGLTADTVPGSATNLYSYDTRTGILTDLTPTPEAGVKGVVNEASEDGSYLYFVATGALTTEKNSLGEEAQAGAENLYLSHDGVTSFIYTVNDPSEEVYSRMLLLALHSASRVTPDGRHLAFFAEESGEHGEGVQHHKELFEYSAESGQLTHLCACAGSRFPQPEQGTATSGQDLSVFQYTRAFSNDGARVFFETYEALLPRDTNGQLDVYEFEQGGTGSCPVASGCLYLISTGTSKLRSDFVDASASGNDVFFTTSQQLVPADTDGAIDLYDARVNGGIPSPPKPPECLGDGCLNVPPAPIDATPVTAAISAEGNLPGEVKTQIAPKAKPTNAQKLVKAVKACGKKPKSQRKRCEARARKRYAKKAGRSARALRANINRRAGK